MEHMTLLIADDEPMILRGLKKLLPWDELGLSIVGEANDGAELREQIVALQPQLLISDISMPGGSGIEIMHELKEQGCQMPVIFISAFQEFDYAREAVKLGALDYLVKPISKSQLEQVVRKAVKMIREQYHEENTQQRLHYYEQKDRSATVEQLVSELLDGNVRALSSLQPFHAVLHSSPTTVCVLEIDDQMDGVRWEEQERNLIHFAVSNIIRETLEQDQRLNRGWLTWKQGQFVLLMQHEEEDAPRQLIVQLQSQIRRYLKIETYCAIGQRCIEPAQSSSSYHSALDMLKRRYFATDSMMEYPSNSQQKQQSPPLNQPSALPDLIQRLIRAWTGLELQQMQPLLDELFDCIRLEANQQRHAAVSAIYHSILSINRELLQVGGGIEQLSSDSELLGKLNACASYEQLTILSRHMLEDMLQHRAGSTGSREWTLLMEVQAYIEQHYASNITLETVAARVYMNPYYFSSFFKKHTGQNFKNHVTNIRMKHALKLLLETDLLIYEIAEKVGYNNVRHFSDMFKKQFGRVPQEYRQACKS